MSNWTVEIRRDRAVFEELAPWWNRCSGPRSTPFLRSEWFDIWSRAFLPTGSDLEVAVWSEGGEPKAVLPLSRRGPRHSALANSHSDVFDLIVEPGADAAPEVHRWMGHLPVTRLFRLDGRSALIPSSPDPNWHVDRRSEAPFMELTGADAVSPRLDRHLIKDVKRLERRLTELGEVVYLDNADEVMPNALEECMRVEASGWKGREGSAIASSPDSELFYRELVELARDRGWLRICALLVGERIAAFELDLDYDGRRFSLKAGYDEYWSRQSPGKVLQLWVLEAAAARGLSTYEFGGVAEPWKLQWTDLLRPRVNALRFGNLGRSRLLGPAIRALATRRAVSDEDESQ